MLGGFETKGKVGRKEGRTEDIGNNKGKITSVDEEVEKLEPWCTAGRNVQFPL